MRKHKNKIIAAVSVLIILTFSYWWGGNSFGLHGWKTEKKTESTETIKLPDSENVGDSSNEQEVIKSKETLTDEKDSGKEDSKSLQKNSAQKPVGQGGKPMTAEQKVELAELLSGSSSQIQQDSLNEAYYEKQASNEKTDGAKFGEASVPEDIPSQYEDKDVSDTNNEKTCILSVRCDSILEHISWLEQGKSELVPKDGIIFPEQTVVFYEGESVFDVLLREMKAHKIHMEYESAPLYNSVYIEGINNLYEYDCGELSGWMYRVNGWFPNYGCSLYKLKDGDRVEWLYTCELGVDVGGFKE